ncbi:putative pollen-specific leucine-rich repeat extensin-like protein 3 [Iris pallida]|uniref:Pollen-specific leucine-rich repeat extensin-like protein 3 n=1 Tax=Iris pallida TaxID=29817 RepID=A0AAX6DQL7_IRIPA|nr:putative pollen-specific leucine-rich repeat extensin-like protein 3 [Iris pallida]
MIVIIYIQREKESPRHHHHCQNNHTRPRLHSPCHQRIWDPTAIYCTSTPRRRLCLKRWGCTSNCLRCAIHNQAGTSRRATARWCCRTPQTRSLQQVCRALHHASRSPLLPCTTQPHTPDPLAESAESLVGRVPASFPSPLAPFRRTNHHSIDPFRHHDIPLDRQSEPAPSNPAREQH